MSHSSRNDNDTTASNIDMDLSSEAAPRVTTPEELTGSPLVPLLWIGIVFGGVLLFGILSH